MTPAAILAQLWADGVTVHLTPDGQNLSAPAGRLTTKQRALVLANKAQLVQFLTDASTTAAALIDAAMRACDQHGDDYHAREQMRADCLATPPHQRADLLDHFNKTYPAKDKP